MKTKKRGRPKLDKCQKAVSKQRRAMLEFISAAIDFGVKDAKVIYKLLASKQ